MNKPHILGGKTYVEIPGDEIYELPPLFAPNQRAMAESLLSGAFARIQQSIKQGGMISGLIEDEQDRERRSADLAINLIEKYLQLLNWWQWGQAVLEWIRQCETTFKQINTLRPILKPDLWPHAGRTSFVQLLADKGIFPEKDADNLNLPTAVGLVLTFRKPPPIECLTLQFLTYLQEETAKTAFRSWADKTPKPVSLLPPERFAVHVIKM